MLSKKFKQFSMFKGLFGSLKHCLVLATCILF